MNSRPTSRQTATTPATPAARESTGGSLTDRQREAVAAANRLGYYETPRTATHADVAAELGCSPQTAGEHLRRAEAKLADAALDEVRSGR
ncbi:helix-turn-helix domain-containing protein [Halosimplex halobium]|uniref:helix-turn-helix domain-containing protein n=1 Tax=Halosimplex halobium TaxID=3396618 RepID=UPI003F555A4A